MKTPDYTFENGLQGYLCDFSGDNIQEFEMTREQLKGVPVGDERLRIRVNERMLNPRLVRGLGGAALEIATLGPDNAEDVVFVSYGWGGNMRHPVARYEAQVLAANNPDKQLVFMNNFGTGNSSLLPRAVSREIQKTGQYGPMGEYVASVFNQIAGGRTTQLRGHSLGARTATGVAPYLEKPADTLILNDPTGTRKMGFLAIAKNFALTEGKHLSGYVDAGFDPIASDLQQNPVESSVWDTVEGTRGGWKQQFLVDPFGLSKDAFESDLRLAIPHIENEIRIISPELSALNDPQDIADILGRCRDVEKSTALLRQLILIDHTHSVVTIPQVLAALYEQNVDRFVD